MASRPQGQARRYAAFISYRHVDADRRWARWLHRWLEGYRVPRVLRKQMNLPGRVGRVFRDEEELAASSDLSTEIQAALDGSDHLVVVCSPHTPASRWVEQEILRFRGLGRDGQILALLVDGEPGAAFPRPLREIRRHVSGPDGASREEIEEIEPLAADVRPSLLDGVGHVRRMAGLRLLACMLGVSFDELRRREHERRVRRLTVASVALLLVVAVISALAVIAVKEGRRADNRAALASARLATMYEQQGRREWLDGRPLRAAPYLAAAYEGGGDGIPLQLNLAEVLRGLEARTATLLGHTHDLFDVSFDAEGARLLTASVDGSARIWDARSGTELTRLSGHQGHVHRARFSPDGSRIGTASSDGTVRLWDSRTGDLQVSLEGSEGHLPRMEFSPDGKTVVTTYSTNAKIWSTSTGELWKVLHGGGNRLRSVRFSADGTRVVAAADSHANVWDLASGEEVCRFGGSLHRFRDAVFSPDGASILTFEDGGNPQLWSLPEGKEIAALMGLEFPAEWGAFSPDGSLVVGGGGAGLQVGIWHVDGDADVRTAHTLLRHAQEVTSARFSPDGRFALTTSRDGTACVWDVSSGLLALRLGGHTGTVWSASWSLDGSRIATASSDASGMVWDMSCARAVRSLTPGPAEFLECVSRNEDSTLALSDVMLEDMSLWDLRESRKTWVLPFAGGSTAGTRATFDPSGRKLAAIILHSTIALMDTTSQLVIRRLRAPTRFRVVAFDSTGSKLATGHEDGTCTLWDLEEQEPIWATKCHAADVVCLAFSADGSRLATGSLDHTACVLDLETGEEECSLEGHRDWVRSVCFHPSKEWLITGSTDKSVKVWELTGGRMRTSMDGHGGEVLAVDVSPEGALVVSGGVDSTVRIWEVSTGVQIDALTTPSGWAIHDVWFGPRGGSIEALAGASLYTWPVQVEERLPSEVAALVGELSPYTLVDGRLVLRRSRVRPFLPRVSPGDR